MEINVEAGVSVKNLGWLPSSLPPDPVFIESVAAGTWAELQGLKATDELTAVDGHPVHDMTAKLLKKAMRRRPLKLTFRRHKKDVHDSTAPEKKTTQERIGEQDDGTFEVHVARQEGVVGFDVARHDLSITNIDPGWIELLRPMQKHDLVLAVDGYEVTTHDDYVSATHGRQMFILTLRRIGRVFDVTVQRDANGEDGFLVGFPPLYVERVYRTQELAPMQFGDIILAVNGAHVESEEDLESELAAASNLSKLEGKGLTYTLTLLDAQAERASHTESSPIRVTIVRAEGLRKADLLTEVDAYVVCHVQGRPEMTFNTRVVPNSKSPEWNEFHDFYDFSSEDTLVFKVWDQDYLRDDSLGAVALKQRARFEGKLKLEDAGKGNDAFLTVKVEKIFQHLAPIRVTIVSAEGLRKADVFAKSDPYCVFNIRGSVADKCRTPTINNTTNPQWDYVHKFMYFCTNDALEFTVWDSDYGRDDMLGKATVQNAFEFDGQLKLEEAGANVDAFLTLKIERIETLPVNVTIVSAKGLRNADTLSLSDPYCICEIANKKGATFKTKAMSNTLQPVWNHSHMFTEFIPGNFLNFSVWDKDPFGADFLGKCSLKFKKFKNEAFNGELFLADEKAKISDNPVLVVRVQIHEEEEAKLQKKLAEYKSQLDAMRSKFQSQQEKTEQRRQELKDALRKNQNFGGLDQKAREEVAVINDKDGTKMREFLKKSERIWRQKEGTLLDELFINLKGFDEEHGAQGLTLKNLAEVAMQVMDIHGKSIKLRDDHHSSLAFVCMVLYTQTDVDIDRLLGFRDVPTLPPGMEKPSDRDAFYKNYRDRIAAGKRNPQMFQDANWATRVSWEGRDDKKVEANAWNGYTTWIRWVCALGAISQQYEYGRKVTRGLTGLPDSILKSFKSMKPGMTIFWAALSSTTENDEISWAYCSQQLPVERNCIFSIYNVTEGLEVSKISQYPNEKELLLPPFTLFEVKQVTFGPGVPIEIKCDFLGCQMSSTFKHRCEKDLADAVEKLQLAEQRARLREAKRLSKQRRLDAFEQRLNEMTADQRARADELNKLWYKFEEEDDFLIQEEQSQREREEKKPRKQGPYDAKVEIVGVRNIEYAGQPPSDFFCAFHIDGKPGSEFKSPVAEGTLAPTWNCTHTVRNCYLRDELVFRVWDSDITGSDLLGQGSIQFSSLYPVGFDGSIELWRGLRSGRTGLLRTRIIVLNPDAEDVKGKTHVPRRGSALLML